MNPLPPPSEADGVAIATLERHFVEHGSLSSFSRLRHAVTGKLRLGIGEDCEDGMRIFDGYYETNRNRALLGGVSTDAASLRSADETP